MEQKLLYFEEKKEGKRIKNRLKALGVKIRHDSGGRILVVEFDQDEEKLLDRLPKGVRLTPADEIAPDMREDLDHDEELFVKALQLRASKDYREMKARQVPGESPEEKLLATGYCQVED